MMKKLRIISLLLACMMLLGLLASCGGSNDYPKGDEITVTICVYDDPRISDPENEADYTEDDIVYLIEEFERTTDYSTVLGVMHQALENSGLPYEENEDGASFTSIGELTEVAPQGEDYGYCWSFKVNRQTARDYAKNVAVSDGDRIDFYYEAYKGSGETLEEE